MEPMAESCNDVKWEHKHFLLVKFPCAVLVSHSEGVGWH